MAAVGQFNSGVTPVLHSEHHAHKDCEQSHGDNKKRRPTKPERLRRGRQRDKLRVQALREQLAAAYSSPSASSSEERPVDDAHESKTDESLLQQCQMKLSMSVHKLAAQQAAVNTIVGVCYRMSAPRILVNALVAEVNSAIANLAAASDYVLAYVPQQGNMAAPPFPNGEAADVSVATDKSESGPIAFNIFDAEDSMWTAPNLPDATQRCDSGDAAAGALSASFVSTSPDATQCGPVATRVAGSNDFKSQDLATSHDFNSQGLANLCAFDEEPRHNEQHSLEQQHVAHVPLDTRQALDVVHAKHRVPGAIDEHTTHNRLRNLTSISQDQGLAPHASHQNFNSQNLAHSPQPCAFQTSPRQELDVDNSKHRGTGTPSDDKEYPQCEPAPPSSRQEHGDLNAMRRVSDPTDVVSQGLVTSAFINLAEQLVTHAKHRIAGSLDFNSQNLASTSSAFDFGPEEHRVLARPPSSPRQELDDNNDKHRGTPIGECEHRQYEHAPQNSRQALDDDNAKHRDFAPHGHRISRSLDFNSQNLATSSRAFDFGPEEHRDRARSPPSPRQELDDGNAKHRGTPIGEQEHRQYEHAPQNTRQARDVDNATHRVTLPNDPNSLLKFGPSTRELQKPLADYYAAVAPVIAAYTRRHKPSNGQVRRAAAAICGIAKNHGITKEQCCQHLRDHSLALMTAATDSW